LANIEWQTSESLESPEKIVGNARYGLQTLSVIKYGIQIAAESQLPPNRPVFKKE